MYKILHSLGTKMEIKRIVGKRIQELSFEQGLSDCVFVQIKSLHIQ